MTTAGFEAVRATDAVTKEGDLNYSSLMQELRDTFKTGKTRDLEWRKTQLKQIYKMFMENSDAILESLDKDIGGGKSRALMEIASCASALKTIAQLDEWAKPEEVPVTDKTGNAKSYILKEPKGVILCISPWNFPWGLTVTPLIDIIAAGNCCVIKPSEVSVHSGALMAELLPKYLDQDAFRVVSGAVPETTALLKERFDHIMYTGNGFVGRIVMKAAAEHLTPITLELGGKCPTYVDETADLDVAIPRICGIKFLNAGQICMTPDYLMVHKKIEKVFKKKLLEEVKKYKDLPIGKMINDRHRERVKDLLKKSKGKVLAGKKKNVDHPIVIQNPKLTDKIMQEEIFGPVLPIHTVVDYKAAAKMVDQVCPDPLALYVFADVEKEEGRKVVDSFIAETRSGGVCVNSALEHVGADGLPFGGIGSSGIGSYMGYAGFKEFTHFRSVLEKDSIEKKEATVPIPEAAYEIVLGQLKAAGQQFGI
eukprot:maker-scaffold_17-snap-gene-5.50-mRNA-1 protein AED:0.01 eAED:0.01 QI:99/1/1/1/1/1/2/104/479